MATQISSLTTLVNDVNSYDCFLPLVDPTLALDSRNVKVRISTHNEMFSNNFAVSSLSSYSNYFGTGKDGSVTISSSAQISSSTSPAGLNNISREFGDPVVKNFQNLTINSGVLFSPLRACRGMVIYCTGNLTVNGTISMTGKGGGVVTKIASPIGIASSTDSRYDLVDATLYFNNFSSSTAGGYGIPTHWNWAPSGSVWFNNYKMRIPLSGSVAGGAGGSTNNAGGNTGPAGIFCCGGGGGGGAGQQDAFFTSGGTGGRGTIFCGGGGGAGGQGASPAAGTAPSGLLESGATGPSFSNGKGGGGAGSPAGSNTPGSGIGSTGVGGLIVLIVRGNITITGTISSNGTTGGNGNQITTPSGACSPRAGGGGGGSGGGRCVIIYGGTYTNAGSVVANGGSGGTRGGAIAPCGGGGGGNGGSGGAGAITVRRVHV
jgi:hypothetical protein